MHSAIMYIMFLSIVRALQTEATMVVNKNTLKLNNVLVLFYLSLLHYYITYGKLSY